MIKKHRLKPCGGNNVIAWFLVKFQVFEKLTCFFPNCTRYHAITYKYIPNNNESDSYNSYIYCGFSKVKENIFILSGFNAIYNSSHIWYIYIYTFIYCRWQNIYIYIYIYIYIPGSPQKSTPLWFSITYKVIIIILLYHAITLK